MGNHKNWETGDPTYNSFKLEKSFFLNKDK